MRSVDFGREFLVSVFRSYFGVLRRAARGSDGKFIATGGENEPVSTSCFRKNVLLFGLIVAQVSLVLLRGTEILLEVDTVWEARDRI